MYNAFRFFYLSVSCFYVNMNCGSKIIMRLKINIFISKFSCLVFDQENQLIAQTSAFLITASSLDRLIFANFAALALSLKTS